MYFDNINSLIHMDGHGLYVWAAYGIGLLVILYNIFAPLQKRGEIINIIQRQRIISTISVQAESENAQEKTDSVSRTEIDKKAMDRGEAV